MKPLKSLLNLVPTPYVPRSEGRGTWSRMWGSDSLTADPKKMLDITAVVSTLFAITAATSQATSLVDWKLYRKSSSGKKEDRTEVSGHPALVVWNKPNPFYTRQEFVESEQQHVDLTGEGWWVLYTDPRAPSLGPTEIWPVRPDRVFPVKHPTKFLTGYVYRSPDGEEVPLDIADVIQLRIPNPSDPYRGLGPVQSLLTTAYGLRAAMDYNRNFFVNNAEPGGIISFPETLEDDDWRRHKRRWNAQHQGVSAAHRVAILEGGATWIDRKYTNRDMEFTGLTGVSRDILREAFLVHKHILGQSDDVNRASALAADNAFAERVTVPRLERFKGALNNDFLPLYGTYAGRSLEFDYCDPRPKSAEDQDRERESKANAYKTLVDAGIHPDDAAMAVGLPAMRSVQAPAPEPVGV